MTRRTAALVIIALIPIIVGLVAYLHESEEEAVERVAEVCRQAVLDGDIEKILQHLMEDAEGAGLMGSGPLAPAVRRWMDEVSDRLREVDLSRREIVVDGVDARGEWLVKARLKRSHDWGGRVVVIARVDFKRGPAGWLIRRVEIARPLS
jgi:ketosteroid isomerase-like protein